MYKHLIFYDDTCSFCQRAISQILKKDKKKLFCFAPLLGKTAKLLIPDKKYLSLNTLILVEDYKKSKKIFIRSKAIHRIYIHLGGLYRLFSFVPLIFGDFSYKFIAKHRHQLSEKIESFPREGKRFLK